MLEDQHIEQVCDNYVNVAYQGHQGSLLVLETLVQR